MDTITKEGKPQTMSGLQDHKLDQPHKQCAASFGVGRSIVEHIFNCRVIIAKHLEHQHNLYHNITYFNKPFDRVCHHGLWKVLISGTIYGGFVRPFGLSATIPAASYPEQSTRCRRRQIGVFTPSCSVQFLKIIHETLNEQHTVILTGDWLVCSLRFADDIDLMGEATTNCKT